MFPLTIINCSIYSKTRYNGENMRIFIKLNTLYMFLLTTFDLDEFTKHVNSFRLTTFGVLNNYWCVEQQVHDPVKWLVQVDSSTRYRTRQRSFPNDKTVQSRSVSPLLSSPPPLLVRGGKNVEWLKLVCQGTSVELNPFNPSGKGSNDHRFLEEGAAEWCLKNIKVMMFKLNLYYPTQHELMMLYNAVLNISLLNHKLQW